MNDELTAVDIKKMEEEIRYRQLELRPKILEDRARIRRSERKL